jgi:hypothetical protein
MTRKLPILCPQEYDGMRMVAVRCDRCATGWDKKLGRCTIPTGVEHFKDQPNPPTCPIQDRCQHQIQAEGPCAVRKKGFICESALIEGGLSPGEAADHPLSFHADMMADPEDLPV